MPPCSSTWLPGAALQPGGLRPEGLLMRRLHVSWAGQMGAVYLLRPSPGAPTASAPFEVTTVNIRFKSIVISERL